jgi:hypothetical protein
MPEKKEWSIVSELPKVPEPTQHFGPVNTVQQSQQTSQPQVNTTGGNTTGSNTTGSNTTGSNTTGN